MNWENRFSLRESWKLLIYSLKEENSRHPPNIQQPNSPGAKSHTSILTPTVVTHPSAKTASVS
jgi:hypothetical protein